MAEINWDDDDVVEKYNHKQAQRAKAAEAKAELRRNVHATDNNLLTEIIKKAEQIVTNIEQGYSACDLETLHIYFQTPFELNQKDAVVIIAAGKGGFNEKHEVKLLNKLCQEEEHSCAPSDRLSQIMHSGQYKDLGMAAPAIVDAGVKNGLVKDRDAAYLKDLYSVWLKGTPWSKCEMSATNRPSLASWKGFPWEIDQIMEKHLNRSIVGRNVGIYTNFPPIETIVEESALPLFKLLWKAGVGRSQNITSLVCDAYCERKADELAHRPTKEKNRTTNSAAEPKAKKARTRK